VPVVIHYIDDCLFVVKSEREAQSLLERALALCVEFEVPMAAEKVGRSKVIHDLFKLWCSQMMSSWDRAGCSLCSVAHTHPHNHTISHVR
jgi:hypothetical protein